MLPIEDQLKILKQGVENLINEEELIKKLRKGTPLKIKFGVDPTRPDLTFGHLVVFNKLKQFQDLGHEAILLIGDYTTTIGDPSGRSSTRPMLTHAEVKENAKTYLDQVFKVLDKSKTTVRYNGEWFNKMDFSGALFLSRKMTVAQMLARDDFSKRYQSNTPISIVEFLYPLLQGHDSVELHADVELGGTDQLFNLLVGRDLQKLASQEEQIVITMPLLVGLDGVHKMSKSLDNYIAFNDSPKDMFGKIMSISDDTMWKYYFYLLQFDQDTIKKMQTQHPMEMKKQLALQLVSKFHSPDAAHHELSQFESVFSKGNLPESMPEFHWHTLSDHTQSSNLVDLIHATKLFPSKNEIKRLIEQGGLKINSDPCSNLHHEISKPTDPIVFQLGKRTFFKIKP